MVNILEIATGGATNMSQEQLICFAVEDKTQLRKEVIEVASVIKGAG
jgi:hypothetical protein